MIAPETNPAPFAVIGKPVEGTAPTATEDGLRNVRTEEDVWVVKLVLNWEQPPASPNITSAAISHLREYIRTRSSPSYPRETPGRRTSCENNPGAEEASGNRVIGRRLDSYTERPDRIGAQSPPEFRRNPRQTGLFLIPPEPAQVNCGRVSVLGHLESKHALYKTIPPLYGCLCSVRPLFGRAAFCL